MASLGASTRSPNCSWPARIKNPLICTPRHLQPGASRRPSQPPPTGASPGQLLRSDFPASLKLRAR
jgi:hypothetical protein